MGVVFIPTWNKKMIFRKNERYEIKNLRRKTIQKYPMIRGHETFRIKIRKF